MPKQPPDCTDIPGFPNVRLRWSPKALRISQKDSQPELHDSLLTKDDLSQTLSGLCISTRFFWAVMAMYPWCLSSVQTLLINRPAHQPLPHHSLKLPTRCYPGEGSICNQQVKSQWHLFKEIRLSVHTCRQLHLSAIASTTPPHVCRLGWRHQRKRPCIEQKSHTHCLTGYNMFNNEPKH